MWEGGVHVIISGVCISHYTKSVLEQTKLQYAIIVNNGFYSTNNNGSTVGADASVEALKLYDMKLLTLAYLALSRSRSPLNLHCEKSEK